LPGHGFTTTAVCPCSLAMRTYWTNPALRRLATRNPPQARRLPKRASDDIGQSANTRNLPSNDCNNISEMVEGTVFKFSMPPPPV